MIHSHLHSSLFISNLSVMSTSIVIIDTIIYLDIIIYGAFREKRQGGKKVRQEEYTLNGPGESISWKAKLLKKFVKT